MSYFDYYLQRRDREERASALAEYAKKTGNSQLADLAMVDPDAATQIISRQMMQRMEKPTPQSPEGRVQADIDAGLLKELPTRGADESALLSFLRGVGNVRERASDLLGTENERGLIEDDTTGWSGTIAQFFPGSQSKRVSKYLDILKSNEALGALKALKEASATGASGLGALNLKELEMLQSSNVALDQGLDEEALRGEVARAKKTYEQSAINMAKKFQETYGYLPESVKSDLSAILSESSSPNSKDSKKDVVTFIRDKNGRVVMKNAN